MKYALQELKDKRIGIRFENDNEYNEFNDMLKESKEKIFNLFFIEDKWDIYVYKLTQDSWVLTGKGSDAFSEFENCGIISYKELMEEDLSGINILPETEVTAIIENDMLFGTFEEGIVAQPLFKADDFTIGDNITIYLEDGSVYDFVVKIIMEDRLVSEGYTWVYYSDIKNIKYINRRRYYESLTRRKLTEFEYGIIAALDSLGKDIKAINLEAIIKNTERIVERV